MRLAMSCCVARHQMMTASDRRRINPHPQTSLRDRQRINPSSPKPPLELYTDLTP